MSVAVLDSDCFGAQPPSMVPAFDRLIETNTEPAFIPIFLKGKKDASAKELEQVEKIQKFKKERVALCRAEERHLKDFISNFYACVKSNPENREQAEKLLHDFLFKSTATWRMFSEKLKERQNNDIYENIEKGMRSNDKLTMSLFSELSGLHTSNPHIQFETLVEGIVFPRLVIENKP